MNILNKFLKFELSTINTTNPKVYLIFSFLFSLVFIFLTINLEDTKFICILAGFLIFWERFLLFKLNQEINISKGGG